MHRIKHSKEYYVFPGGTVEDNETIKNAAVREALEETSIVVDPLKLLYHLEVINDDGPKACKEECYVLCNHVAGTPLLQADAVEQERSNSNNSYKPTWIECDQIKNLLLYPLEVKDILITELELNKKLDLHTKEIKITVSKLRDN